MSPGVILYQPLPLLSVHLLFHPYNARTSSHSPPCGVLRLSLVTVYSKAQEERGTMGGKLHYYHYCVVLLCDILPFLARSLSGECVTELKGRVLARFPCPCSQAQAVTHSDYS